MPFVAHAELVAAPANAGHWSRVRQPEAIALLEPAEQVAGLEATLPREGRALHLALQPHERSVSGCHWLENISDQT